MRYLTTPPNLNDLDAWMRDRFTKRAFKDSQRFGEKFQIFHPDYAGISGEFIQKYNGPSIDNSKVGVYTPFQTDNDLVEIMREAVGVDGHLSNAILYPSEFGCLGWHTNANHPGTRYYASYSEEGDGFFRYLDNNTGEVVTVQDEKGWMFREFDIPNPEDELFWHCVYAGTGKRISFGWIY